MWVNIKYIHVSEKQKMKIDKHKVNKHRMYLEKSGDLMPIDVVKIDTDSYCICGNGRHRYFAALEAGHQFIEVNMAP